MDTLGGNTNATDMNSHGKQPAAEANKEPIPSSIQPTSWLDLLPEEVLGKVAAFLPIQGLVAFSSTSKAVRESKFVEDAVVGLYLKTYRESNRSYITNNPVSGFRLWADMACLDKSLQPETYLPPRTRRVRRCAQNNPFTYTIDVSHPLNRVEILSEVEEDQALLYDNFNIEPERYFEIPEGQTCCNGYFGLRPLTVVPKGSLNPVATPVAVWGDFAGMYLAPSWDAMLNPDSMDRDRLFYIRDDDEFPTQVMDLMIHPEGKADRDYTNPFFLAFASGVVMSVVSPREGQYEIMSTSELNVGEVCSLTIVPSLRKDHPGYLVSASNKGEIYLYPESLTNLDLEKRICLNPSDIPKFQVFSISATLFKPNQAVLCLGGDGLKVHVWTIEESNGGITCREVLSTEELECQLDDNEAESGDHLLTHLSFVGPIVTVAGKSSSDSTKKDLLVTGTNRGHIVTWDLLKDSEYAPRLQIGTSHKQHNGCIESTERVGNMLLTVGGSDGLINTMDLESGTPKVNLIVHPGTRLVSRAKKATPVRSAQSAVVRSYVCHERQSIIGFCRDGHISECTLQLKPRPPPLLPPLPLDAVGTKKKSSDSKEQKKKADGTVKNKQSLPAGTASGRKRQHRTVYTASSKIPPPTMQVLRELMEDMPPDTKALFNQLAFCELNHLHRPVLVLSPLDVPQGRALTNWVLQMKKGDECACLVHWLGCPDSKRAYAAVDASKMTSYLKGVEKGYHARELKKKELKRYEKEFVEGLKLLPIEAAKDPRDRSHPAKKPRNPSDPVQDSVRDDDPRPINSEQTRTPSSRIALEDSASGGDVQELIGTPASLQSGVVDQPVLLKSPSLVSNQVSLQSQVAKRSVPTPTSPSSPRPRKRKRRAKQKRKGGAKQPIPASSSSRRQGPKEPVPMSSASNRRQKQGPRLPVPMSSSSNRPQRCLLKCGECPNGFSNRPMWVLNLNKQVPENHPKHILCQECWPLKAGQPPAPSDAPEGCQYHLATKHDYKEVLTPLAQNAKDC